MMVGASLDETHGLFRFALFLGVINDCLSKGEEESGGNDGPKPEVSPSLVLLFFLLVLILFVISFDEAEVK